MGITGFSRSCLFVKYALSHSSFHFAAASVADGVDGGYFQYLLTVNSSPNHVHSYEGANGGPPFGASLSKWRERSPSFNLAKVQTPIRVVAERPSVVLFEWEWFAALFRLGKPVEMIYMQDGEHILQKPWERLISQQGNVDWFRFWLKGEEDPDPAKAEQYKRWRDLKKLQEANQSDSLK